MRYTKLTVLGLCAILVGLMALGASAAQAEPDNAWFIVNAKGELVLVKKPLLPILKGELENKFGVLDADVLEGSVHVEVRCTGGELVGVHLMEEGKLSDGGKVKFTGCKVWLNGEEAPECKVHAPATAPVGTVTTNEGKGLLELHLFPETAKEKHKTELITLVKPLVGEEFVKLLMGSECVIGEEVPVKGYLAIKDCELSSEKHLKIHLIEEEPELTLLEVLDDLNAQILGSAKVFLTGEHEGLLWGAEMFKL
jgi:hypothetical protein